LELEKRMKNMRQQSLTSWNTGTTERIQKLPVSMTKTRGVNINRLDE
jgi:hypothetical protein